MAADVYDKVVNLAKRRGFINPSFEVYGGQAGFYDYGPLGVVLKRRIEDEFRRIFVQEEGCFEIDTPTVTPHEVLEASGHVSQFTDPVVRCGSCGTPFRADHLLAEADADVEGLTNEQIDEKVRQRATKCAACGGPLGGAYRQNLMFETEIGPKSGVRGYLRPETAQGIFVNFPTLYRHARERLPFGVVQVGRAYRNEISPRQGMLRLREFNQMEMEYFVDPKKTSHPGFRRVADRSFTFVPNTTGEPRTTTVAQGVKEGMLCHRLFAFWLVRVHDLLEGVGVDAARIRFRQHKEGEMAHYANDCWDAEVKSERFGWVECVGIADRSAFDLDKHSEATGVMMSAVRPYKEPKTVRTTRLVAVNARLGPLFRQQAKTVAQALEALPATTAKAWRSGPITVRVDGEDIEVPPDAFTKTSVEETVRGQRFVPNVLEPSFGVDRILYHVLEHAFDETKQADGSAYTTMRLRPTVAPIQVAVLPLMSRDGLDRAARRIEKRLRTRGFRTYYDESGSIGRRYARQDEAGTPLCVTVDYETATTKTVTVRVRDTGEQERVATSRLASSIRRQLTG